MPSAAKSAAAFLLILSLAATCSADLRVRIKESLRVKGRDYDSYNFWYFKGRRSRSDANNFISIYQCDLMRAIYADNELKRYEVNDSAQQAKQQVALERFRREQERELREKRAGGTITVTVRVEDTGERREMFGYTARRIKTTIVLRTSPDACSQAKTRRETDGWYADLLYGLGCSADISGKDPVDEELSYPQSPFGLLSLPDPERDNVRYLLGLSPYSSTKSCIDRVRVERQGTARLGFPLVETATEHTDQPDTNQLSRPTIIKREVVEIDTSELDASLFDTPAGYKRVKFGKLHSR